jgi:ABC-2 type transport system ATP-binding protein
MESTEKQDSGSALNIQNDSEVVINITTLSHSFKARKALDNVSFKVHAGSLHGFVGPNGAGKTTTLKAICTLLRPQEGDVHVFGHSVLHSANQVRQRIGFMPDHFSMYRQMTVFEYLDFFAAAYGLNLSQRNQVITDVLTLTDMDNRRDDLISGLSRGMQQRVSLSRVLVHDPDLLLLDEPASGLDPRARIELMDILRELQAMGKTIFISSHILSELAELCDSVTIIDRGSIKYSGPMDHLLGATEDDIHPGYTLRLSETNGELIPKLKEISGVIEVVQNGKASEYNITCDPNVAENTNSLLKAILELDLPVVSFAENRKHLNQAFMDLTSQGVPD